MKIAFTGKGGVGKTTIAALLIKALAKENRKVLAVDCDADSNLARALGFSKIQDIIPICEMKEMIFDRMGIRSETDKSFYKMNPAVEDIPAKYSITEGNIKLIVMGAVKSGGSGCICPESAFLKSLLSHIVLNQNEDIVLDMEAGVEHLGRSTARSVDYMAIVVEPNLNSIQTALKIKNLAQDIGIEKIIVIGNKIRNDTDRKFIKENLKELKFTTCVPFSNKLLELDKAKRREPDIEIFDEIYKIKEYLFKEAAIEQKKITG